MHRTVKTSALAGIATPSSILVASPVSASEAPRAAKAMTVTSSAPAALFHGTLEVDGVRVSCEDTQSETSRKTVEEYRTSAGKTFRAELSKTTGEIQVFRNGVRMVTTTARELAAQLPSGTPDDSRERRAASSARSSTGCAVGTAVVGTANGLLWGAVGLAIPPAAPVAYVAGAVTTGIISAAGTQC